MKIVVDNKIPYIQEAIKHISEDVVYLPGSEMNKETVKDADALIIRTRTKCNEKLLSNSKVQFIATATIGHDHIDKDYCKSHNIVWKNAPGCNATSVAQYVQSALLLLEKEKGYDLTKMTIGIVGVGNVGKQVNSVAKALGCKVLLNDPIREEIEGKEGFSSLQEICEKCNVISFHTPLVYDGKYPTFHLADEAFFHSLKLQPVIINTSRGEVIDTSALKTALQNKSIKEAVIDVWENEPHIDLELLEKCYIATPHIAGYSADGKANATRMALEALCQHFHITTPIEIVPPQPENTHLCAENYHEALLRIYTPRRDEAPLRSHPDRFEQIRGDYPLRREPNAYHITIQK